jgi:hypothetical protein
MRNDLTDLTIIMDRSGSMAEMGKAKAAEEGINALVSDQKTKPGECTFTLVQFDVGEEEYVHNGVPVKSVNLHIACVPRGGTALLDAVGRTIIATGNRLKGVPEHARPGLVLFVIVTDGEENSSLPEFKNGKLKQMIEHQTSVYKWQFQYLGAGQDAFAQAGEMGVPAGNTSPYKEEKTSGMYGMLSNKIGGMRAAAFNGATPDAAFTNEERVGVN